MENKESTARDIAEGLGVVAAVGVGLAAGIFLGPIIGVGAGTAIAKAATSSSSIRSVQSTFSDFAKDLVGSKLSNYKNKCRPLLKSAFEQYSQSLKVAIAKECHSYSAQLLEQIKVELKRCLSLFENAVNKMIEENEAKQLTISTSILDMKQDVQNFQIQKQLLASIKHI